MTFKLATSEFAYSPLAARLRLYLGIIEEDLQYLDAIPFREKTYAKESQIIAREAPIDKVMIITSGWAARSRYTRNGDRQIIHVLLAGDIVTPDAFVLRKMDHEIEALSTVTVRYLELNHLTEMFAKAPSLSTALWWASAQEDSLIRDHVVQLGRRSAIKRVAHFILELHRRLVSVGQASDDAMILPISQNVISDALGLTFVTVSRSLTELAKLGFVAKSKTILQLIDLKGLASFCDFDIVHFHLDNQIDMTRQ